MHKPVIAKPSRGMVVAIRIPLTMWKFHKKQGENGFPHQLTHKCALPNQRFGGLLKCAHWFGMTGFVLTASLRKRYKIFK